MRIAIHKTHLELQDSLHLLEHARERKPIVALLLVHRTVFPVGLDDVVLCPLGAALDLEILVHFLFKDSLPEILPDFVQLVVVLLLYALPLLLGFRIFRRLRRLRIFFHLEFESIEFVCQRLNHLLELNMLLLKGIELIARRSHAFD